MTVEQIQQFLDRETVPQGKIIRFEMKKRNPIRGLVVKGKDYQELKGKNFWRIVTQSHLVEYNKTQNINLAKIFSGTEFAKLSLVSNKAED
jgi:hypothetical protein